MEPTYFAQYRGFEFYCSPARLESGHFAPRLVIHEPSRTSTLEIELHIPVAPFEDPTAAAHQAFAHGRRWVDSGHTLDPADAAAEPRLLAHDTPALPE